jgi:hypothetical protein
MKIIEKKCPNCGANLKFKPGDREAHCESCRREFIIERENGVEDLIPAAKLFGKFFAVQSIIISVISIIIFGLVIFGIIYGIVNFNKMSNARHEEYESRVEEMDRKYQESVDEMNRQFEESTKR